MTIRKSFPPRDYETFPSSTGSEAGQGSSQTPASSDTDKPRLSPAHEAQRLASQGSWADNIFQTPGTNLTPTTSAMGEEDRSASQQDPNEYPSDPPPLYTPTDTTASTVPSSPVTTRAEPVRAFQPPRRRCTPTLVTNEEVDEEQPMPGAYIPSSPLLERGEPICFQHDSVRWKDGSTKHRIRRRKKAVCFTFALVCCLWLMLPSLFFYDKPGTSGRHSHHPDKDQDASPIPTWPIPKREYRQHQTSRSISGTFQLYDLLDLETTSGSISITVETKPGNKSAVMRLASTSGSINVRMAGASWLPWKPCPSGDTSRTFDISVSTTSGSVNGNFLAGNGGRTEIASRSGSLSIIVHTVGVTKHENTTTLATSSNSGSQTIKVVSCSTEDVRAIEAKHLVHGSGSLGIQYPKHWMGKVHAHSSGSGSVFVHGHGLEKSGGGRRSVYGWRGEGDLKEIDVHGFGSGSVHFSC